MKSKPLALALVFLFLSALTPPPPVAARDLPSGKPAEVGLSAARLSRIAEVMEAYEPADRFKALVYQAVVD